MNSTANVISKYLRADVVADIPALSSAISSSMKEMGEQEQVAHELLQIFEEFRTFLGDLDDATMMAKARDPDTVEALRPLWKKFSDREPKMNRISTIVNFYYIKWFRDMWDLSLAILQQSTLPGGIRRKIERASRYWASKQNPNRPFLRVRSPGKLKRYHEILSTYLEQLSTIREQYAAILEATASGTLTSDDQKLRAGSFLLVNTGGFKDEVMANIAEAVKKSEALLTAKGLSKVCYGDIHISKKVGRSNVLAFYLQDKDEMFIRAGVRASHNDIQTIIHELAHRLHEKFLKSKTDAITALYRKYKSYDGPYTKPPEIGTTIDYRGEKLTVVSLDYFKRRVVMKMPGEAHTFSTSFEGFGTYTDAPQTRTEGFITKYAETSPSENFAEMVAFYCMGELSPRQVVDIEEILG